MTRSQLESSTPGGQGVRDGARSKSRRVKNPMARDPDLSTGAPGTVVAGA